MSTISYIHHIKEQSESREWPDICSIGLSSPARQTRQKYVGGSDANIILGGDPDRLLNLWAEKLGETIAPDLSAVLPVMLGSWTEAFNRQWYEARTGFSVTEAGTAIVSQNHSWRRATLDGLVSAKASVWEAKHVNAFSKPEEVLSRYMPQLQHNMAVVGLDNAILSVIYGNHKWECYEIAADWAYQLELLDAEESFWRSVLERRKPVTLVPPPAPKVLPSREVSFEGNNKWAVAAADWRENVDGAKLFAEATRLLKGLLDEDVTRAWGYGVEAKRSKSGSVTLREYGA